MKYFSPMLGLNREGRRHWRDSSRELFLTEALGHKLLYDHRHGKGTRLILVDFAHHAENVSGRFVSSDPKVGRHEEVKLFRERRASRSIIDVVDVKDNQDEMAVVGELGEHACVERRLDVRSFDHFRRERLEEEPRGPSHLIERFEQLPVDEVPVHVPALGWKSAVDRLLQLRIQKRRNDVHFVNGDPEEDQESDEEKQRFFCSCGRKDFFERLPLMISQQQQARFELLNVIRRVALRREVHDQLEDLSATGNVLKPNWLFDIYIVDIGKC